MKIAIQGHLDRGKEIIQILESLGGINRMNHNGRYTKYYYYISNDNNTIRWTCIRPEHLNVFTLEEFETQFPFKVGDLCIYSSDITGEDIVVKILGMTIENDCIMYEVGNRSITKKHSYIYRKRETLRPYKEMKEERNITLTLEKAKEWYKKGGELKEIALQAFTEKELKSLPRSWEEFCKNYHVQKGECWLSDGDEIEQTLNLQARNYKNWIPSMKSAEAHLAMIQLEQLRDCWRQGNIPQELKYKIRKVKNIYTVVYGVENAFLSFCDNQTAEEFLKCFRDLIEQAGDLI